MNKNDRNFSPHFKYIYLYIISLIKHIYIYDKIYDSD